MTRTGLIALLFLAGCNAPREPAEKAAPAASAVEASTPSETKLTPQGFGPLRIGMTRAQIEASLGPSSNPNAVGSPEPEACDIFHPRDAPSGLKVMIEQGILTSVWLDPGASAQTDHDLTVGAAATGVRRAYGAAIEASPHKYETAPAEYLFVWTSGDHSSPTARGLKYEIGRDGKVRRIAAGGPSIQYVEGCA